MINCLSFYVHNVAEGCIIQSIRQEYLRPHRGKDLVCLLLAHYHHRVIYKILFESLKYAPAKNVSSGNDILAIIDLFVFLSTVSLIENVLYFIHIYIQGMHFILSNRSPVLWFSMGYS